jgi:DNA processing protein
LPTQDHENGRPKHDFTAVILARLISYTGSRSHATQTYSAPEKIFHASLTELEAVGLLAVSAQAIAAGTSLTKAEEEIGKANAVGAKILTRVDPEFPTRLLEIYDPPLCL